MRYFYTISATATYIAFALRMHHSIKMQRITVISLFSARTDSLAMHQRRLEMRFFFSRNIVVAVCYSCRPVLTHSLSQKSKLTQLFNWALGCGTRTKKIRSLSCDVYILNVAMMTHNGAMQAIQCSASICAKNKPTMKKTKKKKKKNKQQYPGHNINKWQR